MVSAQLCFPLRPHASRAPNRDEIFALIAIEGQKIVKFKLEISVSVLISGNASVQINPGNIRFSFTEEPLLQLPMTCRILGSSGTLPFLVIRIFQQKK